MGKQGKDGAPSSVNPGDSATRQEVRLGGLPTRTRWGGYHLARPGGPPGAERRLVPEKSNLKPQTCFVRDISYRKLSAHGAAGVPVAWLG